MAMNKRHLLLPRRPSRDPIRMLPVTEPIPSMEPTQETSNSDFNSKPTGESDCSFRRVGESHPMPMPWDMDMRLTAWRERNSEIKIL